MSHPIIRDPIIVIIVIASVTKPIFVMVLLPRVGKVWTVVLKKKGWLESHNHNNTVEKLGIDFVQCWGCDPSYLLAVVGGVLHTQEVFVGPSIQVGVISTDVAIASVTRFALTAEHGVTELTQVDTVSILVAIMAAILAGVTGCAHLGGRERYVGLRCASELLASE